jgi:hypothetical protein
MTALVLALAGLAAGDGGPGTGAATAPLTDPQRLVSSRDWEGTVQLGRATISLRLRRGEVTTFFPRWQSTAPFALILLPGGLAAGHWGGDRFHGTYKVQGGRLFVCVAPVGEPCPTTCTARDGILFTLKPAVPRKP